jgi:hypothetical protein
MSNGRETVISVSTSVYLLFVSFWHHPTLAVSLSPVYRLSAISPAQLSRLTSRFPLQPFYSGNMFVLFFHAFPSCFLPSFVSAQETQPYISLFH